MTALRRLLAAVVLVCFGAALAFGATLCVPPTSTPPAAEDCCQSGHEPEDQDLGCAPACPACATLSVPTVVTREIAPRPLLTALAPAPLSGYASPLEHVPRSRLRVL